MQPNNFAILTAAVRFSDKLTDRQKLLCAEISALTNLKGYCWASNKKLGDLYGRSPETISRDIKQIEDAGFIRCEYLKDNTRRIYLLTERTIPIDETVNTSCRNRQDPIDETVKHNNINNRKNNIEREKPKFNDVIKIWLDTFGHDLLHTPNQGKHRKYIDELIGRGFLIYEFEKVIKAKKREYDTGSIGTHIILPYVMFKPENFENNLAIINNPKPPKQDKFKGKTKGAKVASAEEWERAAEKYKDGWQ